MTTPEVVNVPSPADGWDGEDLDEDYDDFNGRECPYFARYMGEPGHDPNAVCAFGCVDEPSCITDQPRGGWPPLPQGSGDRSEP